MRLLLLIVGLTCFVGPSFALSDMTMIRVRRFVDKKPQHAQRLIDICLGGPSNHSLNNLREVIVENILGLNEGKESFVPIKYKLGLRFIVWVIMAADIIGLSVKSKQFHKVMAVLANGAAPFTSMLTTEIGFGALYPLILRAHEVMVTRWRGNIDSEQSKCSHFKRQAELFCFLFLNIGLHLAAYTNVFSSENHSMGLYTIGTLCTLWHHIRLRSDYLKLFPPLRMQKVVSSAS